MMHTQPGNLPDSLRESLHDCIDDCDEVQFLLDDNIKKIHTFVRDISHVRRSFPPGEFEEVLRTAESLRESYADKLQNVRAFRGQLRNSKLTVALIREHETGIAEIRRFVRTHQATLGACITSTDWQSPSFNETGPSQAGRQTGTIYPTMNDYKRDQHWDAFRYEQAYRKEFIDGLIKIPINVYATVSGMGAFATIMNYLIHEHKISGPVVIGKSVYFEIKALILSAFGSDVIEVDESDTKACIETIKTYSPSAIFFDSLANSEDVAVPDLTRILSFLVKYASRQTFCIIDNTCLSAAFQPYPLVFGRLNKLRLIVFESLNKFHQYGEDRVTGGVAWTYGGDTGKLFSYRDHSGTNIPDLTAVALPTPNRRMLMKRLSRLSRNATAMAGALQTWIDANPATPFERISYPGLSNHPAHTWSRTLPFTGAFFVIVFKKRYRTIPRYKRFVAACMAQAKRTGVRLISGTSFGLDTTRVYLTAVRSHTGTPFIRIAAGTETKMTIESITAMFLTVFSKTK